MSVITYGFLLGSGSLAWVISVSALVAFFVSWYQLYYRIIIGQSQYQDSRALSYRISMVEYQIYRTFAYTPGIGNEGGMC